MFDTVPPRVKRLIYTITTGTISYGYLMVVIAGYFPEIGLDAGVVGLVLGTTGLAVGLGAIPLGALSDRRGRKWVLIIGTCGLPVAFFVFALETSTIYLVLAALLVGLAEGLILSTWNALIADQTSPSNRDAALSLSFIITTFSFGFGSLIPLFLPFLGQVLALSSRAIHSYSLLLLSLLNVITPLVLWGLLKSYVEVSRPRQKLNWKPQNNFEILGDIQSGGNRRRAHHPTDSNLVLPKVRDNRHTQWSIDRSSLHRYESRRNPEPKASAEIWRSQGNRVDRGPFESVHAVLRSSGIQSLQVFLSS